MKLIHILRAVYCEPWLIRPEMHVKIAEILQAHVDGSAHDNKIMDIFQDDGAELTPRMTPEGVCVIPIDGVIGKRASELEKSSGVVDCNDITAALDMAMTDTNVKAVVLDFNSPGGTVTGTPEVAAKIKEVGAVKPIIAYTDMLCCSAAYWMASQADAIYAAGSACVGSIGVYAAILDQSRAYEMAGLKQEVFKAGKLKGMGVRGTSLTTEQRDHIQASVDGIHAQFKTAVREGRGKEIDDDMMEGQDFYASECLGNGLVDSIATLQDAIRDASAMAKQRRK